MGLAGAAGATISVGLNKWLKHREDQKRARENRFWPFKTNNATIETTENYFINGVAAAGIGRVANSVIGKSAKTVAAKAAAKVAKFVGPPKPLTAAATGAAKPGSRNFLRNWSNKPGVKKTWNGIKATGRVIEKVSNPLMMGMWGMSMIPPKQPEPQYDDQYYQ
jgi:hypothetical protein